MRGTPAALFWPWPKLALLPVVGFLLCRGTRPQGSTGPLQCYGVGPWGDLNCTWEPLGDLGSPSVLHLQSQKYHSNRTQKVAVPAGQHWVTIPRGQLTTADKLLIWGTQADQPLWPQVFVNLETQMRPDAPNLHPDVVFSEDPPLEAFVQWAPPPWPPHKALTCQFHYRSQEMNWTLLEPELKTIPPSPVEIQDLEPATSYNVSGRCRVEEADLWGPWSLVLSFQTPPSGPKDVWVSGNLCEPRGAQEPLLLWKASGLCAEVSYTVWFWLGKKNVSQEGVSCCKLPVPTWAEWASVAAANAIPWAPLTNLSLLCLAPESAPRGVKVRGIARGTELLVTWEPGIGEASEFVVDWSPDGDPQENLSWIRLSPDSFRAVLPGNFEGGVPYQIRVTAISPEGLAPAPAVWGFREELAPLVGPALWRLRDDPPEIPAVAWGEVPRPLLRGRLTHYTLCVQGGTSTPSTYCMNVSSSTQTTTLPDLPWGPCELWVTASTKGGQGPPGPSLRLHLPDNTLKWRVLPSVLSLWVLLLLGCGLSLAASRRCLHLRHKVLPRWVWEKVPDPANSHSGQDHIKDLPILEVEEMEPPPVSRPPQASTPLHSGYEKHFLPTPEELGLLRTTRVQVSA
ncbi:interleukin-27 receptor subunit alpha isoform X2 [Perognathus longimembris pacificus]|uniref:interleukin-27 receptor subunit alpha isoform X2 n=1 Tax=Perognathus longimembris pacificus TaxID=214514 RepID=UPI002019FE3F|nr:interleukin-27 receptor subunit alpha isoform X2 [Perognathus longimembris pacificus]